MSNITDITNAFENGDFARPNLFEVEVYHLGEKFKYKCKATVVPPSTVEKIPVGYMNRKINVAGDRTYDDWNVTVYMDDNHGTRDDLIKWSNSAHGTGNEITGDRPDQYKKVATVRQFSRDGKTVTKEYNIVGIFPTNVGEIQLDWDSNNEVETCECTFAIDWVE